MCEKLLSTNLLVWMKGRGKPPQDIVVLCLHIAFDGRTRDHCKIRTIDRSIFVERRGGLGRAEFALWQMVS